MFNGDIGITTMSMVLDGTTQQYAMALTSDYVGYGQQCPLQQPRKLTSCLKMPKPPLTKTRALKFTTKFSRRSTGRGRVCRALHTTSSRRTTTRCTCRNSRSKATTTSTTSTGPSDFFGCFSQKGRAPHFRCAALPVFSRGGKPAGNFSYARRRKMDLNGFFGSKNRNTANARRGAQKYPENLACRACGHAHGHCPVSR